MASNIIKFTDYDEDQALFENFNDRIHIRTENVDDDSDGVAVSIDKEAARRLIGWLQDTVGPSLYDSKPTLVEEED